MFRIRDQSMDELDIEAIQVANRHIDKQRRLEKKEHTHNAVKKELDLRDKGLGVRQLKKPYQPIPYIFKDSKGKRTRYTNSAEAAAEHVAIRWKMP